MFLLVIILFVIFVIATSHRTHNHKWIRKGGYASMSETDQSAQIYTEEQCESCNAIRSVSEVCSPDGVSKKTYSYEDDK